MALDFSFTEEQKFFRKTLRDTVNRLIMPKVEELDESQQFPWDLWREFAGLGYLGLRHKPEYGGSDSDTITQMIFYEELARGSCGFLMSVVFQVLMGTYFIGRFGSEEIKQRILVPAIRGEKIATICFTEEQSGSDLSGTRTLATKVNGGWRIHGKKTWITNAPIADFATVMATVDPKLGLKGLNFFLVEKKEGNKDGFERGQTLPKIGARCSTTGELIFDNVFVPDQNFLGEEVGMGVNYAGEILNEVRTTTALTACAIAREAMEHAKSWANIRVAHGKPIGEYQLIREKFAKFWAWYEAARHYAYRCAWMIQNQIPCLHECMMCKVFATEMCMDAVEQGMRIHGGNAYCTENPAQRYWRDAKFLLYGGGAHEVLWDFLGKSYLKRDTLNDSFL
ncbi:MAG: acyl-CoA dehydrogenase family protein [Desulfarculaceae bacterium]|jgi:alkylation response protein AidB-like acyl-CoA dehydrogenase